MNKKNKTPKEVVRAIRVLKNDLRSDSRSREEIKI